MKRILPLLLLALAVPAVAQTADPPAYILGAGAGWNHYGTPQANGWMTFGARVSGANYSFTSLDMTSVAASLRTGYARLLIQQDNFSLLAIGDLGVISGEGSWGGAASAGGSMAYDISRWTKVPKTYVVGTVRVMKSALNTVQPVFCVGAGKSF